MAGYTGPVNAGITAQAQSKEVFAVTTSTTAFSFAHDLLSLQVFHNGIRLVKNTDYSANGVVVTLTNAALNGDQVVLISNPSFQVADAYTRTEADAAFLKPASSLNAAKLTGALPAISGAALTGISTEPFKFAAATGATPALNVGASNFFDSGTLTANTAPTFTSVPTTANWRYSFVSGVASGYSFSDVSKVSNEFVVNNSTNGATALTESAGMYFKPDGLKLWIVGHSSDTVHAFTLSTAWDISTASYDNVSYSVASQENAPFALTFKPDGTMFFMGGNSDALYSYNLSTAWDISTASYSQTKSVTGPARGVFDIIFKPDGLKAWLILNDNRVWYCTLSTAWSLSTMSITSTYNNFVNEGQPHNFLWNPDGTKCFITQLGSFAAYSFIASTPYDVSSSNLSNATRADFKTSGGQNSRKSGIAFGNDGKFFYTVGDEDVLLQYNTGLAATLTLPSSVVGTVSAFNLGNRVTYTFFTSNSGTAVNLIAEDKI